MRRVMKHKGLWLLAVVAAGLFALQAADKNIYTQKDEKDILQVEDQWTQAVRSGDTATLEKLLADDYVFVDPNGQTLNKAQEIARYRSGEVKFTSFATSDKKVIVYIGGAIVTGQATVKGKHKKEDISGNYRFVDVIEKRKAAWQPVYSQITRVETEADRKKKETKK
jgi:ketosteroid isomerase-like protein